MELQLSPEQSVDIVSREDMANVVVALTVIVHKMVIECYKAKSILLHLTKQTMKVINKILLRLILLWEDKEIEKF